MSVVPTVRTYRIIDGQQVDFRLDYSFTPIRPATLVDPACGGVEPETLWIGGSVADEDDYPDVWRELLEAAGAREWHDDTGPDLWLDLES